MTALAMAVARTFLVLAMMGGWVMTARLWLASMTVLRLVFATMAHASARPVLLGLTALAVPAQMIVPDMEIVFDRTVFVNLGGLALIAP